MFLLDISMSKINKWIMRFLLFEFLVIIVGVVKYICRLALKISQINLGLIMIYNFVQLLALIYVLLILISLIYFRFCGVKIFKSLTLTMQLKKWLSPNSKIIKSETEYDPNGDVYDAKKAAANSFILIFESNAQIVICLPKSIKTRTDYFNDQIVDAVLSAIFSYDYMNKFRYTHNKKYKNFLFKNYLIIDLY